jgi:hypothetical protein
VEAVAWSDSIECRIPDASAAFDIGARATSGETVDAQEFRAAANQIRDAAEALSNRGAPDIAAPAQDQVGGVFNSVADLIDSIADAVESGDTAAVQTASDEIGRLLFDELSGSSFGELLARCPILND